MVCFYDEFDLKPLDIWKRIEGGRHFTEENCTGLLDVMKKHEKKKRKANEDRSPKRIKLETSMETLEIGAKKSQEALKVEEVKLSQAVVNLPQDVKPALEEPPKTIHESREISESSDLSIIELNFLIDNFEELKSVDQNNLISFLQKLELENPEKFKKLN